MVGGGLNPMTGTLIGRGQDTGHMKTKAELERHGYPPRHAKACREPPGAGKVRKDPRSRNV